MRRLLPAPEKILAGNAFLPGGCPVKGLFWGPANIRVCHHAGEQQARAHMALERQEAESSVQGERGVIGAEIQLCHV